MIRGRSGDRRPRVKRLQTLTLGLVCALLIGLALVLTTPEQGFHRGINADFSPQSGTWFGGAVNLDSESDGKSSGNPQDVLTRERQLCRKYDNLHYYLFALKVTESQLDNVAWAIDEHKTPVVTLSWPGRLPGNPDFIPQVASGQYDSQIATTAERIKALGGRVLLRPYWEFNHADNGLGAANYGGDYDQFISAWRRTHTIFMGDAASWRKLGIDGTPVEATNVRFSWTPGNARPNNVVGGVNEDYRPYYPGDEYVDWIGIDSYTGQRMVYLRQALAPPTQLIDWYDTYSPRGKPMTIGEIGIHPQSTYPNRSPTRAEWYANARDALLTMPMIKLFSYFDVSNNNNPLDGSYQVDAPAGSAADSAELALAAYSALANDPLFGQRSSSCPPQTDLPSPIGRSGPPVRPRSAHGASPRTGPRYR